MLRDVNCQGVNLVAGLNGGLSANKKILLIQVVPAALGLVLLLLAS
ncbi:DUF1304 family protein [Billgrantia saliphila]|nr:DUF1304 family protein [Halomonas saliphila]